MSFEAFVISQCKHLQASIIAEQKQRSAKLEREVSELYDTVVDLSAENDRLKSQARMRSQAGSRRASRIQSKAPSRSSQGGPRPDFSPIALYNKLRASGNNQRISVQTAGSSGRSSLASQTSIGDRSSPEVTAPDKIQKVAEPLGGAPPFSIDVTGVYQPSTIREEPETERSGSSCSDASSEPSVNLPGSTPNTPGFQRSGTLLEKDRLALLDCERSKTPPPSGKRHKLKAGTGPNRLTVTHNKNAGKSTKESDCNDSIQTFSLRSSKLAGAKGLGPAVENTDCLPIHHGADDTSRDDCTSGLFEMQPISSVTMDDISSEDTNDDDDTGRRWCHFSSEDQVVTRESDLSSEFQEQGPTTALFDVLPQWQIDRNSSRKRASSVKGQMYTNDVISREEEDYVDYDDNYSRLTQFMICPNSLPNLVWNALGLTLIGYDCVVLPLQIFDPPPSGFTDCMEWIIRLYWTVTLFVSFFTGYMTTEGTVVMHPSRVAKRYILSWFLLDILVVGLNWLEAVTPSFDGNRVQGVGSVLRSLRMIRTLRLVRLLKARDLTKVLCEYIPFSEQLGLLAHIGGIMAVFLWASHVTACLWFGLGRIGGANTWKRKIEEATAAEDLDAGAWYILSFHWSLAAYSGDTSVVLPTNTGERMFASTVLFFAFVVSASYVGSITTSMTRLTLIASEQSSKLARLRRFLLDNHISRPLAVRVQRNAQHAMVEQKSKAPETSVELLRIISVPVLIEVHFEIHARVLMWHPFFPNYNEVNPGGIRQVCHSAISMLSLHTRDLLFHAGEVPSQPRMFFVVHGGIMYMKDKNIMRADRGMWMCEQVLWTNWTHAGTARTTSETTLLAVSAEKFQEIVSTFPTEHAGSYARAFVKSLNTKAVNDLSDIGGGYDADMTEVDDLIDYAFPDDDDFDEDRPVGTGVKKVPTGTIFKKSNSLKPNSSSSWRPGAFKKPKMKPSPGGNIWTSTSSDRSRPRTSRSSGIAGNVGAGPLTRLAFRFVNRQRQRRQVDNVSCDEVMPGPSPRNPLDLR